MDLAVVIVNAYLKGHFRHLQELYEHDELTSAINRIVENINHRFTLEVLTGDFKSNDLEISRKNLRRDREQPTDILDRIDLPEVTKRLEHLLEIRNLPEQSVELSDAEFLRRLIKMEDYHRLNENETRTEFVEAGSGIVSIVIEECAVEAKCVVIVNYHEGSTSYDFTCAIFCESIKKLKRCRKQLVNSFASYQVSGFPCGYIAEDRFDLFNYMVVGTGVYSHFAIDTMSQSQLSSLENRISEFKHRHFSDTATVNGRILIHGGANTDLADVEKLAEMFQKTQGLNEMLVQLFLDYDQQNVHDIDIWLFPAEK